MPVRRPALEAADAHDVGALAGEHQAAVEAVVADTLALIDVEALPEAPPGSNADRIGRGLPPLSEDEPSEEEIRERRRALGLPEPKFQNDNQL